MITRLSKWLPLLLAISYTSAGCSVIMAASGSKERNIGAVTIGQDREVVVLHLGSPTRTLATSDGRSDIYELERGNEPSAGRAALHGGLDVLTLGIWEVVGTPIEAMQGEKFTVTIHYDSADKVTKIESAEGAATAE